MKTPTQQVWITPDTDLQHTIKVIDQGALQIALVVDAEKRLIGTVTDGDIRRGLLNGLNLDSPVEQIMNRQFRSVREGTKESEVLALMRRDVLHQIPALDAQGRVVNLFLLEELLQNRALPNPVVIMSGGEGKRLRPLTKDCPKPMLNVKGKPMLEIILDRCKEAGFQQFYLSVNYLKQQIIDYFGDGSRWGINIEYLEETQPLGTAGALKLLPPNLSLPFLVLNGDVLTQVPYSALLRFHEEHEAFATVSVKEHETFIPFGVVETKGNLVSGFQEKPTLTHYVNAGVYALSPNALSYLTPTVPCDMPELLQRIQADNHSLHAFPIHENWLDVGRHETLRQAGDHML